MKTRTKVRAGSLSSNKSAKKLVVRRPRGVDVRSGLRAGALTVKQK